MQIESRSVEQTREAGARLARVAKPGDVFVLEGDLGTGKTEFVRGFTAALGEGVAVRSPSFSILNIYQTSSVVVYHFDFYRLNDASELWNLGFDDYISGDGVCLIEWGTMFTEVLPEHTKIIRFFDRGDGERFLESDFEF